MAVQGRYADWCYLRATNPAARCITLYCRVNLDVRDGHPTVIFARLIARYGACAARFALPPASAYKRADPFLNPMEPVMPFKASPMRLLVLAMLASATVPALAKDPSYTIEDVKACSKDALRLCRDKLGHLDEIEACMRAHFSELRPRCQARFK